MKKEELKNLTPEMVEELRSLGVEFENTALHYFKGTQEYNGEDKDYGYYWWESYELRQGRFSTTWDEEECKHSYRILPAPNLQEVLEKLKGFSVNYDLSYRSDYTHSMSLWKYGREIYSIEGSHNLLILAFHVLKYVATNRPETLKGGMIL